jgi:polyhydroxyalkanoate synthesis regulator phasin
VPARLASLHFRSPLRRQESERRPDTVAGPIASEEVADRSPGHPLRSSVLESARDLISYMVRRGQMTPEEGDKLLREAEVAHKKRPKSQRNKATATEIQMKERKIQRAKAAADREKAMKKHIAMVTKANAAAAKKAEKKAKSAGKKKK